MIGYSECVKDSQNDIWELVGKDERPGAHYTIGER